MGDVYFVALCKINAASAKIVVPAVGMVMSVKEYDIKAVFARRVKNVKYVIGIFSVTVIFRTHAVMQRKMGNHEDGFGIFCCDFGVQIGFQIVGRLLNATLTAVVPHIVIFIDDKHAVLGRIMGAAGSQSACSRSIMVALYKHHTVICQGSIFAGYCIL